MQRDLPIRVGLLLSDEWLVATRLLSDGQQRRAYVAIDPRHAPLDSLPAALAQVLDTLLPAGEKNPAAPLELALINLRPLARLRRHELPQVALLAPSGLHEALHASLRGSRSLRSSTHDPSSAWFPWVGDAADLISGYELSSLCPAENVLPVPIRQDASGALVQSLSVDVLPRLVPALRALSVPAAALSLMHSPRSPQPEHDLAQALQREGFLVVPSATQLALQHGGGDERLRTRAAVLSAALASSCEADLRGLRAGIPSGRPARILTLRSDGILTPSEQVPAWQQIVAPIAAGLIGISCVATPSAGRDRFVCLIRDEPAMPQRDEALPFQWAVGLSLAALCNHHQPGWPAVHAALCLGIPCELPALSAALLPDAMSDPAAAHAVVQTLASAYGYRVAAAHDAGTTSDAAHALSGDASLSLVQARWLDVLSLAALRAGAAAEQVAPLFVEASGAQHSGLIAAHLQRMRDEIMTSIPEHVRPSQATCPEPEWTAELRYRGQLGMLSLRGIGTGGPASRAASDLVVRFVAEHQRVYGFSLPECPVEIVQVRLRQPLSP